MSTERIREMAEELLALDLASRRAMFAELSTDDQDAVVAYLDAHHASYRAWLEEAPPQGAA
jgi:hypothetical protein